MSGELGYLSADFQIRITHFATPASQMVLGIDPSRWSIVFAAEVSGQNVWVLPDSTVANNRGLLLATNSPILAVNFRDLGGLIQGQWFAFGGPGSSLVVIETLYRPVGQLAITEEDMHDLSARLKRGDLLLAGKAGQ